MLTQLIDFALNNRLLVLVLVGLMAASGVYRALDIPIDAVPDMTNVQVQVVTDAGSLSPLEVEQYVTYPVESTMGGLPDVQEVRSVSKFGLSLVTVVFEDGMDIHLARKLVSERLIPVRDQLRADVGQPQLGPLSTALGEVLQFEVRGEGYSAMQLRTLLEWTIAPQLREVAGVTEVNSHGGQYKTFEVQLDPQQLASHGIALSEVIDALASNNVSTGGGYIVHHDQQRFIRAASLLGDETSIEQVVVRSGAQGGLIFVRDLGEVKIAPMTRQGAVTRDGRGEAVTGMVIMLLGGTRARSSRMPKRESCKSKRHFPRACGSS